MINFNHLFRGTALALSIAGGLAFAGQASAYDYADLVNAQAIVDAAEYDVEFFDFIYSDIQSEISDNNATYANAQIVCSVAHARPDCWLDAYDEWYSNDILFEPMLATAGADADNAHSALNSAIADLQVVSDHQNGVHGQP